ncbi:MAG: glycosyltransferase family 2 protein [Micrococcales bacterium]|nr:glycosyltransferase family 2 protein [Micrococcales bacterium]
MTIGSTQRERGDIAAHLPTVSVVVPAYNEAELLPACLASLAAQDYPGRIEVIVVDNASTDQTARVAGELGAVVLHEPQPGVCYARQRGTLAASGDIIVSTDADTAFSPGWLTGIVAALTQDPARAAVAGPCLWVDAPWWGRLHGRGLITTVHAVYRLTGRVVYASATNIAFWREAFSGYDVHATQGGDEVGLLVQLRRHGAIHFARDNVTFTSARRMRRGLWYNVFVTVFYYYLLGYVVNKVARRAVIGSAPHLWAGNATLVTVAHRRRRWGLVAGSVLVMACVTVAYLT